MYLGAYISVLRKSTISERTCSGTTAWAPRADFAGLQTNVLHAIEQCTGLNVHLTVSLDENSPLESLRVTQSARALCRCGP